MLKKNITVLVTGVGGAGVGEQILKALKMAKYRYQIVGTDTTVCSKGLMETDYSYVLPPASEETSFIKKLIRLCQKHNVKAVFPGSEPELKVISKNRKQFSQVGVYLFINPPPVLDICLDKLKTNQFLADNGFSYPRSVLITKLSDLKKVNFSPTVLKPISGSSGSANIMLAQTPDQLRAFSAYLLKAFPQFLVQEYVGTYRHEYTVGVLLTTQGKLLNSIVIQRNIMTPLSNRLKVVNNTGRPEFDKFLAVSSGVSQGEVKKRSFINGVCEKIALSLGGRGAINIQCRTVKQKVYVFEINPRFSGTTSLRALAGYNEPDLLIREQILGETIRKNFAYRSGYIVRGLNETFIKNKKISNI